MARTRNIKPGFFINEDLADCGPLAMVLFAGLWTVADRLGRLEDRPKRIKLQTVPYFDCDADELLNLLAEKKFILRYEVDGHQYIQISEWEKHQQPHVKEQESTIPAPINKEEAPDLHGASMVQAPVKTGKRLEQESLNTSSLNLDSSSLIPDASSLMPHPSKDRGVVNHTLRSDERGEGEPAYGVDNFTTWFEGWWLLYPKRNGKRIGKGTAQKIAQGISSKWWDDLTVAVTNYAASGQIAKDPERFLKNDYWREWLEPAVPETGGRNGKSEYRSSSEKNADNIKRIIGRWQAGDPRADHHAGANHQLASRR
jgi:hypothetical protein